MHPLTELLGIEVPLNCGPMYPCSKPELIAAVSGFVNNTPVVAMLIPLVHSWARRSGGEAPAPCGPAGSGSTCRS